MANGSSSSDSDGQPCRGLGAIGDALENRIVLLFSAVALGIGGNLAIVNTSPEVRADPFTGTMGQALEERIHVLESRQALDDQHRQDAIGGYGRVRSLERDSARNEARIEDLERRLDKMNGG